MISAVICIFLLATGGTPAGTHKTLR